MVFGSGSIAVDGTATLRRSGAVQGRSSEVHVAIRDVGAFAQDITKSRRWIFDESSQDNHDSVGKRQEQS